MRASSSLVNSKSNTSRFSRARSARNGRERIRIVRTAPRVGHAVVRTANGEDVRPRAPAAGEACSAELVQLVVAGGQTIAVAACTVGFPRGRTAPAYERPAHADAIGAGL